MDIIHDDDRTSPESPGPVARQVAAFEHLKAHGTPEERADWMAVFEEGLRAAVEYLKARIETKAADTNTPVEIVSFGYSHGPAPEAHAVVDVRYHFKDPHVDPALRYLTAEHAKVMAAVLGTAGIPQLVESIVAMAHAFRRGPRPGPVTIAVGCVGGRHRSAGIAIEAARLLERAGVPVTLTHRDMGEAVIERPVTV